MNHFDIIVVGVGAMGSAACLHLARRGAHVLGLEQFGIPHALGSSHGYSRAIRLSYHEHPDYVPLLRRAWDLWRELETSSGQTLLHATGGLYLGPPGSEMVQGALASARRHGLAHEFLNRSKIAERFPQFDSGALGDDWAGLWEQQAGLLLPERVIAATAELALRAGARLHGHETVTGWDADAHGVTVHTDRASYSAGHLVLCGGAWSERLVRNLGVPLVVTRQVLGWVWPRRPDEFTLDAGFPTWAIHDPDAAAGGDSLFYGFPLLPDNPGFKIARHRPGASVDPDTVIRHPLPGDEDDFRPGLRFFPGVGKTYAHAPTLAVRICLYTNSPDGHFIVDSHPDHPGRVSLACGFSGHGFKFASVMGEVLADLALGGRTDLPVGFLGLSRFARDSDTVTPG